MGLPFAVLLAAVMVFTVGWTWFDWLRYTSFDLSIYDLGLNYQLIWSLAHGAGPLARGSGGIHPSMTYPIILLFAPFLPLFPSQGSFIFALLLLQSGFLAVGALVVYSLVVDRFKDRWAGLGLGLAYLAVPALCGPVWFPFHFESLFPTLFLLAYWQQRRGNLTRATALWILSLTTNIAAPLVVGAFALGLLVEPWIARRGWWPRLLHRLPAPPPPRALAAERQAIYLLAGSVVVFGLISLALLPGEGLDALGAVFTQSSSPGLAPLAGTPESSPWGTAWDQTVTVLLLLGPLLFLPVWGRAERWATIPFFAHLLVLGNPTDFLWPFTNQYACFVLPGLFAAAVRALERPWGGPPVAPATPVGSPHPRPSPFRRRRAWRALRRPTTAVLVTAVVTGAVFAAWGPFNVLLQETPGLAPGFYPVGTALSSDPAVDTELRTLIGSVPPSGTLLVQNNLVQAVARWDYVVPGFYSPNDSVSYVLTDPYNSGFYNENNFGPYPTPMYVWANQFLARGWGVEGEASGAVLLAANWSGPPVVYFPLGQQFLPSAFAVRSCDPCSPVGGVGEEALGPSLPVVENYSALSPGTFDLTVRVGLVGSPSWVRVDASVESEGGARVLSSYTSTVGPSGSFSMVNVTFVVPIPLYYTGMAFDVHVAGPVAGEVQFAGISWTETSPMR